MSKSNMDLIKPHTHYDSAQKLLHFHFSQHQSYCLFLDIDGTISEFHVDPQQSFIAKNIIKHLEKLQQLGILIAAVTGRTVQDATRLFAPLSLPIAGTHGLEIQYSEQKKLERPQSDFDFAQLHQEVINLCQSHPKLLIEQKAYAVAIHFREHPECADIAEQISKQLQDQFPQLRLNAGKCVYELILKDADKGQAILKLYQHFNQPHLIPIFIGDDQTDESAFKQINQLNGISIKIGKGLTTAKYRLKNVNASAEFIESFKEFILSQKVRLSQVSKSNGEKACLN